MPARKLRIHHQEDVRRKIQCSQLINRLMAHFEGKIELSPTQVRAAEILLNKALANAPIEMTGDMTLEVVVRNFVRAAAESRIIEQDDELLALPNADRATAQLGTA